MRSNIAALSAAVLLAACATAPTTSPADIPEVRPGTGVLSGYLQRAALPDSLALLPPPPVDGSAAMAADQAAFVASRAAPDAGRWALAAADNELRFPQAASTFACALDLPIGETTTPHVNMLLRRTLADAGLATYRERSRGNLPRNLYLLEEPTIGLHLSDCEKLIRVLHSLVDQGHTVVVIEHNLEVVKTADWVIDMGPEGGDGGGVIVAQGRPEDIAASEASHTGRFLREVLARRPLAGDKVVKSKTAKAIKK
jgi:hypothetical protein